MTVRFCVMERVKLSPSMMNQTIQLVTEMATLLVKATNEKDCYNA